MKHPCPCIIDIIMIFQDDVVVLDQGFKRVKLTKMDRYLRRFQYRESLAASLTGEDEMVMSLLMELDRRDVLEIALTNQEPEVLIAFVGFLNRSVSFFKIIFTITYDTASSIFNNLFGRSMILVGL